MIKKLLFLILPLVGFSQGYTSYFTGNTTNITTATSFGVCLMGGATENDNAMKWLLQKANGGDVVVLRSSGSNGYNNYLYSELGIPVNSVETLVITSVAGATNPYVLNKVANAEMIWFAGGDQFNYVSYFKDNALEDLLNNHINVKNAPIGGTSAGMAILGGHYFSAQNGSVTSTQAMTNPFASNVTLGNNDFLNVPVLNNVITDTHFDNPDRKGRLMTFMARLYNSFFGTNYGIACNEYVAVCIDNEGNTQVFGDYPNYQEFAYFTVPNCISGSMPEILQPNVPLTWNVNGEAVSAYKVAGLPNGSPVFNIYNFYQYYQGLGGSWKNWKVVNGVFTESNGNQPLSCLLTNDDFQKNQIVLYPNPVNNILIIDGIANYNYSIYDSLGKLINVSSYGNSNEIDVSSLSIGIYLIKIAYKEKIITKRFNKI
ncbi:MAG: T9SS type A sorting domain-containing protein [Flavobacterium sp.]|uniref:T9SS type A sorting domain-containing protein n=1 Tax=Flavobacterium sp. TaxID=239 RepID=UPI0022CA47BA|nr:T9SS type A sorting domain-containing protein [Flavobacterium sp.]MCZ8195983.1 T9SS type A sorting domain-containing protein [Flavobacterium sp.]